MVVNNPNDPTLIEDSDNDTKIQTEESSDEDIIRFDCAGTEVFVMNLLGSDLSLIGTNLSGTNALDIVHDVTTTAGGGANFTMNALSINSDWEFNNPASGGYGAVTQVGINIDMDGEHTGFGHGYAPKFITGTMDITNNSGAIMSPFGQIMDFTADFTGTTYSASTGAYHMKVTSQGTGQLAALRTNATQYSSGEAIGYQGFASGVSTATAGLIGVQGLTVNVANTAYAIGVDGNPGGTISADLAMGVRSVGHLLCNGGSGIIGGSSLPNTTSTTHLDFVNNTGEFWVNNAAEFDGAVYLDGGLFPAIVTKTGDYTALVTDHTIIVDASGGAVTITLPTAAASFETSNGLILNIKSKDSANVVTIDGAGSETIDGSTTMTLATHESITIQSDGTEWWII